MGRQTVCLLTLGLDRVHGVLDLIKCGVVVLVPCLDKLHPKDVRCPRVSRMEVANALVEFLELALVHVLSAFNLNAEAS
jgi:hypothetical protein